MGHRPRPAVPSPNCHGRDADVFARLVEFVRRLNGPRLPGPMRSGRLVACGRCGSEFVHPVAWHEHGDEHWWIRLRCGQCVFVRELEVSDDEAARFDRELDRGVASIAATVARIERDGPEGLMAALRSR
jgi:hypothetical protein